MSYSVVPHGLRQPQNNLREQRQQQEGQQQKDNKRHAFPDHAAQRRAGQRIDLTNKEFALLQLLLQHKGEVMSRSQIASQVWDMNFDSDTNVVDVAIRRLRAKIDDGFDIKLIQTVRGMGYRIEDPLA